MQNWCKSFITHIILVGAEGLGNLDHYFTTTLTIIKIMWAKNSLCVIIRETRRHAQGYVTLGAFLDRRLSEAER